MRIGIITGALLLLAGLACAAIAADSQEVALEADQMPIEQAMAELSKQAGVQIVCDSDVKGTVTAHFGSIELEKALDTIAKLDDLKWQKVYLPAQSEQKPTLEQIKARALAIAAITGGPMVVCDPATGKQKVFVEQDPAAPSVAPEKLGLKPVYLISKPKVETKVEAKSSGQQDTASRFQSLQDERMKLLSQMTPDQRISAMQQEMTYMLQVDPATRQQMMLDQMKARQNMDPQMRDQLRQVMRDTWQSMRDQGLIPADQGQGRRGRRGGDAGSQ